MSSSNQAGGRAIGQQRESVSIVEHLRSEGYTIKEGAAGIWGEIDEKVPEELRSFLTRRDGAAILCESLPTGIIPGRIADEKVQEVWHLCGLYYLNLNRLHEALAVFMVFYEQMLRYQEDSGARTHKGTPLVRISECHQRLGHTALSKRYLMLTLCEDAIRDRGRINA